MGKPDHPESAKEDSRCAPTHHRFRLSTRQITLAAFGVALLVLGVVAAEPKLPVGPIIIVFGSLVLLAGVALPLVHQVQLGAPMLFTVTIAAEEQRVRLHSAIEDCRGLLIACAGSLCPDAEAAARAVEASLSKGLGDWHGGESSRLRGFLLCLLVHEARFEAVTHPPSAIVGDSFLQLPLEEREVLVLLDRANLARPTVARMLGLTEDQVEQMREHALASVVASRSSS
jgi:hypothetical protein